VEETFHSITESVKKKSTNSYREDRDSYDLFEGSVEGACIAYGKRRDFLGGGGRLGL
jgi:hypothetical protein